MVSMIAHRVRAAHPSHESTHFPVDERSQNKMVVIGQELIAENFNLEDLQRFV